MERRPLPATGDAIEYGPLEASVEDVAEEDLPGIGTVLQDDRLRRRVADLVMRQPERRPA
jgi:hypothetical protein